MKTIKYLFSFCLVVLTFAGCVEDEKDLNFVTNVVAPTEVSMLFNVTQDNTGLVTITPIAEGAILFDVTFGDETEDPSSLENGENISHTYAEGTYTVSATAYGITGLETTVAQELVVSFKAPANLEVTIENDSAISKRVNVTATAEYAITFDVYSGVTDDTTPVSGNIGEVVALDYEEPGTYTITVVAKSAAIETVEYMVEFEVTAIVAPLTAAPTPPSRDAENVVSIYSDAYTDVTLSEVNPGWGQSTVLTEVQVEENNTWFYSNLDYTGIVTDYGNATDVSAMEYVHFDYWTPDATVLGLKLVNTSYETGDPLKEHIEFVNPISLGSWVSVDIPLENFLNDTSGITQLLFDTTGNNAIVYIDNLYFHKEPSGTAPLIFDDFEGNGNIDSWFGDDCGMDNEFSNPYSEGINTSSTVLEYNDTGGTYSNIRFDTDSAFDIATNSTFSLKIYVPSSGITGSQPNQISMKLQDGTAGEPWTTQTEIIKPLITDAWQLVTFDFVNDTFVNWAGITETPSQRTDLNRVVIQLNSEGNSDAVIAYLDDVSYGSVSTDTAPFATDDFEGTGTITTWFGDDCGMDNEFSNPYSEGINTSSTVLEYADTGGTYSNIRFDVEPNFDLTAKSKYTLKLYVPSSSITGSQTNQISLKLQDGTAGEPWTTQTEIIKTIVLDQWQIITFDFANDTFVNWAGITDAPVDRTDLNRVVIQLNSEGNSDNVTGYIDDFNYHN